MDNILDKISSFFHSSVNVHDFGTFSAIDMPFLDWKNDFIRIYAESTPGGNVRLSDSCDTYRSILSDIILDDTVSQRTADILLESIDRFGSEFNSSTYEISMECPADKVGICSFMFGQSLSSAFSAVGSSISAERNRDRKIHFRTAFRSELTSRNLQYEENYQMPGRVVSHDFDFLVNARQSSIINLMSEPTDKTRMLTLFEWKDVIDKHGCPLYVMYKDDIPKASSEVGRKISKQFEENNIIQFSMKKDYKDIESNIFIA